MADGGIFDVPYSTKAESRATSRKGRLDGRSTEIQRLIGRSLRAVVDLEKLGPRTMWVDCDVLQADGGTRTAAITGCEPRGRRGVPEVGGRAEKLPLHQSGNLSRR